MNKNKIGKPYPFSDSFLLSIGHMRIYFHLPYRQIDGIKATGKNLTIHSSYSQVCYRRINKVDIFFNVLDNNDNGIIIALNSTEIKVNK